MRDVVVLLIGILPGLSGLAVLSLSLLRWRHVSVLYGRVPIAFGLRTLGWTLRTANLRMLVLPMAVLIWLGVSGTHSSFLQSHWMVVCAPGVLCLIAMLVLYSTPPSVLLLGSSNSETVRLMTMLHAGFLVYRVVGLLHKSAAARVVSVSTRSTFEGNNLRILGKHDWRTVVFPLADEIALIIVDTRSPSPAVIEEIRRVLADDRLFAKSLFIVSDDDGSDTIDSYAGDMGGERHPALLKASDVLAEAKRRGFFKDALCPFECSHHHSKCCRRIERAMQRVADAVGRFRMKLRRVATVSAQLPRDALSVLMDAGILLRQLEGRPGDGLAQAATDLARDIAATEEFIGRWTATPAFTATRMRVELQLVYHALLELQCAMDISPPDLLDAIRRSK